jgi:hypothetical protein
MVSSGAFGATAFLLPDRPWTANTSFNIFSLEPLLSLQQPILVRPFQLVFARTMLSTSRLPMVGLLILLRQPIRVSSMNLSIYLSFPGKRSNMIALMWICTN